MPTIYILDGIKILMYFNDHAPPHFHVEYNEFEEIFDVQNLETQKGKLPSKQRKKLMEWAKANQDFLQNKWDELNNQ